VLTIPDSLVNAGKGYNTGLELTVEKFFCEAFGLGTPLFANDFVAFSVKIPGC